MPGIKANYYEVWTEASKPRTWRLEKAYLHLLYLKPETGDRKELLAVHCDPNEPPSAPHASYKRGLHIHVGAAGEPIKHAHLVLNRHRLPSNSLQISAIGTSWQDAIQMVADEILSLRFDSYNPK
ncbi:MAG: hypothetical protein ACHQ9S_05730 [Candidatus Binatia bacterium]